MLGRMRAGQSERLASETADEREATLERMRADHSERLASETVEEREARLERTITNRSEVSSLPQRLRTTEREARLERIHASLVSYPDSPSYSTALGVFHHQHVEREGLETLAQFACANGMQSSAKSRGKRPQGMPFTTHPCQTCLAKHVNLTESRTTQPVHCVAVFYQKASACVEGKTTWYKLLALSAMLSRTRSLS